MDEGKQQARRGYVHGDRHIAPDDLLGLDTATQPPYNNNGVGWWCLGNPDNDNLSTSTPLF